jgi:hypothetical protein
MTLHALLFSLRRELTAKTRQPRFGTRVRELRNRLVEAKSSGKLADSALLAEARVLLAELDERHVHSIVARIKSELDKQPRSPEFLQDVARLQRFLEGARSVWEPHESAALRQSQSLLAELRSRGSSSTSP